MSGPRTEDKLNPHVFGVSVVAGMVLALGISIGVRWQTGHPPGFPPAPFAHLLGEPAPLFEVDGLDGTTVSLQDGNHAGIRLLVFTNSGCRACDAVYPSLKEAAQQVDVVVVGVGDRQELAEKVTQYGISSPVGYDRLRSTVKSYGVTGFPSVLLIDGQGIVQKAAIGSSSIRQVMETRRLAMDPSREDCVGCEEKK